MTLHEIDKEMASISQMYEMVKKQNSRPYDPETKKTLQILDKAKLELSSRWWAKAKMYAFPLKQPM